MSDSGQSHFPSPISRRTREVVEAEQAKLDAERAHYLALDALGILCGPDRWRRIKDAVQHQRTLSSVLSDTEGQG